MIMLDLYGNGHSVLMVYRLVCFMAVTPMHLVQSLRFQDSRWNNYHDGKGLAPEVRLINWNDGGLGIAVGLAYLYYCRSSRGRAQILPLVLITLFRDATLWRETVEYMWDHHRKNYPYTIQDQEFRDIAILCLWTVNGIWLIAPIVTLIWAHQQLSFDEKIKSKMN